MEKTALKFAIIVLNWNGKQDTLECLTSLQAIDYPNYEIIVVDNGSQDGSVKAIRQEFKTVTIVENPVNLGFAEGNNMGISYALFTDSDYIFLLNNDTIVDPQILNCFLSASQSYPQAGIFGAKIYLFHVPQQIWYAGAKWNRKTGRFSHIGIHQTEDHLSWNQVQETPYACGCALVIKAEVVRKIGLLDRRYFLMWEEADWCFRSRAAGYTCLVVPDALVWHKVSASFQGISLLWTYFYERNRLLWLETHLAQVEPSGWVRFRVWFKAFREIVGNIRRYCNPFLSRQKRLAYKVILWSHRDYLLRRFGDAPAWIREVKTSI
jgi:GT2 family glycosyltransferase